MPENETPVKKSQAIRDFLAEYPDASPKTVAEALTAQGIPVSSDFVSAVRSSLESSGPSVSEPEMPPRHIHITITRPPEGPTPAVVKKKASSGEFVGEFWLWKSA